MPMSVLASFTRALKEELAMIEHSAPLRELTATRSDEDALIESLCARSTTATTCRAMDKGVELAPMTDAMMCLLEKIIVMA
jgi:hypothetical protein